MNWILILGIGIPSIAFVFVARFIYRTYNELTWHRVKVDKIAGNLEAVLKKKYDMIPALVEVVKGYAHHESSILTEIAKLRSQWGEAKNFDEKIKTANMLDQVLSRLLVVQENYPKLKADKSFQNIQRSIISMEHEILNERKYYNEVVRRYNVRVKLFPRNVIAKMFGFKEREFFQDKK
ncbi:MAG: LemA family protein [Candidatus Aenigmarchaeota archaeon]|nr:LemA family protein [Candidatus Aenigmarchaeota archaeon]